MNFSAFMNSENLFLSVLGLLLQQRLEVRPHSGMLTELVLFEESQ